MHKNCVCDEGSEMKYVNAPTIATEDSLSLSLSLSLFLSLSLQIIKKNKLPKPVVPVIASKTTKHSVHIIMIMKELTKV